MKHQTTKQPCYNIIAYLIHSILYVDLKKYEYDLL